MVLVEPGSAIACAEEPSFKSPTEAKRKINRAIESVAQRLGNTKAICRKSYIHPAILECYMDRSMDEKLSRSMPASVKRIAAKLRADEVAALKLLHCARSTAHSRKAA